MRYVYLGLAGFFLYKWMTCGPDMHGLADVKGITEADVDPRELAMGIKVELEHTRDYAIAKQIALDHLAEIPDYYTRLQRMERAA